MLGTNIRSLRTRLLIPLAMLMGTHLFGTIAFYLSWLDQGGTVFDALFMTFTTVTTIGYGEVHPLSTVGRVIAMLVAGGGIGSLFYTFTVILDAFGSDEARSARRRRRMQTTIDRLSGHYLIVGYGRIGREAAAELIAAGKKVVVLERSTGKQVGAEDHAALVLEADGTDDAALLAAGITRATGLIVTTSDDATNLFVTLSARLLAPKLFIASRASDDAAMAKLQRAGADRVISPWAIGGRRLAHLMLSPRAVDFFETALRRGKQSLSIGEIPVSPGAKAVGKSLDQLKLPQLTGASLLVVMQKGVVTGARGDLVLSEGDHVLALGTDRQLEQLEGVLGG